MQSIDNRIRRISFLVTFFFSVTTIFAQSDEINIDLNWSDNEQSVWLNDAERKVPGLKDVAFVEGEMASYTVLPVKYGNYQKVELELIQVISENANAIDQKYVTDHEIKVKNSPEFTYKASKGRGKGNLTIIVRPYFLEGGTLKKIKEIKFEPSIVSSIGEGGIPAKASFASQSVLREGSGQWFKLGVVTEGIYRLDRAYLESIGVDVANLDPASINIYGNAQGVLPIQNDIYRPDDLVKNAIYVQGEGDGNFGASDYVLFYAVGADQWEYKPGYGYEFQKHLYSDENYYFLNIDPANTPKRIQAADLNTGAVTDVVTTFDAYNVHELEEINLIKSGQRWYGELFDDVNPERTLSFAFPNIVAGEDVKVKTSVASTVGGDGSNIKVYQNGTQIQTLTLNTVSGDNFASRTLSTDIFPADNASMTIRLELEHFTPSLRAWLDKIEMNTKRELKMYGSQMKFAHADVVGVGNVTGFQLDNANALVKVWEVTDPTNPGEVASTLTGSVLDFAVDADSLRQFVAFNGGSFYEPVSAVAIEHQNLHALPQAEYLIVTHENFLDQAERLADLHRDEGMEVHVVTVQDVYNEFSGGMVDPVAIRWFAKMFYDRAGGVPANMPKYMCLFGDGTYDPKNRVGNNNYYMPVYEWVNSENHVSSLVTDDFFGMLDDDEDIDDSDQLDIAIGRLIVSNAEHAKQQVDKVEHYIKNGSNLYANANGVSCNADGFASTFGDWRLSVCHIADDENGGTFINDHEGIYDTLTNKFPDFNSDKIYLDAYKQVSTTGGQRYPDVPDAIDKRIGKGATIVNYIGHGGETGMALERVVTVPQIQAWKNINNLNMFISATCEFTRYDDPGRVSAGEWVSLNPYGGAIALMTTTRPVYISVNSEVIKWLYSYIFNREADGKGLAFGEIVRLTKNSTPSGDNKRSFTLIGDPALRVALPYYRIVTDSVNGHDPAVYADTLKALGTATIKGHIEDLSGAKLTSFNGYLFPTIFDKAKDITTLGQDPASPVTTFELQKNILYKGKATVSNGDFSFDFIVPKDIDFEYGFGKLSYYAEDGTVDASGNDKRVYIGGIDTTGVEDNVGPTIELFLNDENFVNGGITDDTPILIAKVFDESGINTVGNGIGHDITVYLDGNTGSPIVLNDFYEADLDTYKSGEVRYPFGELAEGQHTLTFKIWDVNNNSSEASLEFIVQNDTELAIDHVLNYPNPFTTKTEFFFEHNRVCSFLEAQVQIFTVSGKLVKTINETVTTDGFRSEGIVWDGRDDFGDRIGKGVYVYQLTVRDSDGQQAEKIEKLVLLK